MDMQFYVKQIEENYQEQFEKLFNLLINYNKMLNLTSIIDKNNAYEKHFLDSIVGEQLFKNGAKVVEIGSGGGFPSIPLKIVRDDLDFTLIESTGKKCTYLQTCVDNFDFKNVKVMNIRAEDGGKDKLLREKFDVAVARAVARLNSLCEYCMPFVKVGGIFVAYKGDVEEELNEAQNAIKILGGKVENLIQYNLPSGDKRSLVVIKKVAPTPPKYPRGQGKERKSPL
jgi:16S rRNA (guanine527-N7)-methyltransferase